jgi:TRPM family ion channel
VSGTTAPPVARVAAPGDVPATLKALGIATGRPVLVVIGGAGGMSPEHMTALAGAVGQIIQALGDWGAAVVDGGTDSGVMRVIGQARDTAGASFPLVGVAAEGTVIVPGTRPAPDAGRLDPHHTQVILVPGNTWGDESPWLSRVAAAIADGRPSVTLAVNGGEIAYGDIEYSLEAGRPVIVLAGTGRTADAIADAARGRDADPRAARVAAFPGTRVVPLGDPAMLRSAIGSVLAPAGLGESQLIWPGCPRGGSVSRRLVLSAGHRAGSGT